MKEILKKFIFNLYTLIIAPLIVISLTPFWTKIKLKEFLILIITFIKSITLTILNFKIPIWAILMGVFILFLLKKSIFFKKQPKYPDWFYNFKSFKLKEWLFSWEYDLSLNIINLKPICFCKWPRVGFFVLRHQICIFLNKINDYSLGSSFFYLSSQ